MKEWDTQEALSFLNNFITYRQDFAKQYNNGAYGWYKGLNDKVLNSHIEGRETIAIKVQELSKYLTFDLDFYNDDIVIRKQATRKLINTLIDVGIEEDSINVFFSGNKGFHVVLFFDEPIRIEFLKKFFDSVMILADFESFYDVHVDCRGGVKNAYKLPLGVHRVTKKRSWYCDTYKLEPKEFYVPQPIMIDKEGMFNLITEVSERSEVVDKLLTIKVPKESQEAIKRTPEELEAILEKMEENRGKLNKIVQQQKLIEKGSRNDSIFLLALYCNSNGFNSEEAKEFLYGIMQNTDESMFNNETTLQWKCKECDNVVNRVYLKNWKLFGFKVEACFNKVDIIYILKNCKTLKQMQVLLCFMIYSKQFSNGDGVFFLSERTAERETGIDRKNIRINIKKLEASGVIEKVEAPIKIKLEGGKFTGVATKYKIPYLQEEDLTEEKLKIKIKTANQVALVEAVKELVSTEEVKASVTKNMFYKTFKSLFN